MVGSSCEAVIFAIFLLQPGEPVAGDASPPLGSQPSRTAPLEESSATPLETRPVSELRSAIRDAMRESARTNQPDHEVVVPKLIDLYHEVDSHADLPRVERRTLRGSLRSRLLQIEDILRRRLTRAEADAKRKPGETASRSGDGEAKSAAAKPNQPVSAKPPATTVLAQQGSVAGGGGSGQGPTGAGGIDRGWQLVELIRATVAPDSWDVNGGEGSIYYYRPLNVMVIRQTQAVHGEIGDVLNQMRRSSQ